MPKPPSTLSHVLCVGAVLFTLAGLLPATSALAQEATASPTRPRIGLVLSGGGARGLAHVGVLKVLERERIPVDVVVGTSMGAIVGGLYAAGMSAEEIEAEVLSLDWDNVFANRVERRELSQRRKEQDFEFSPVLELGLDSHGVKTPLGSISSRGLESHLRRMTLPVRQHRNFDELPIPFRALATDMETGSPVVLKEGDLATALRSSMSVPGVFSPVEVNGRVLGDGGLVDNVPIGVARAMGVDRLIVVNVGTPIGDRRSLESLAGVTAQMINILTEQNVQRSLATLAPQDVLITPNLGQLTAGDFNKASEFVTLGRLQASAMVLRIQDLKVDEASYQTWMAARRQAPVEAGTLAFVKFEGSKQTRPEQRREILETQPGEAFDVAKAERDARRLAATGDYVRSDYRLVRTPTGDEGMVFQLEDKPWGPDYLQVGLDLSADNRGRSTFNLKLAHNRHWLDDAGSEWRNFLRIGSSPAIGTEWYRPMNWKMPDGLRAFVSTSISVNSDWLTIYEDPEGRASARLERRLRTAALEVGTNWRQLGELRLGYVDEAWRDAPDVRAADYTGPGSKLRWSERGWQVSAVFDQLDHAYFPTQGWRATSNWMHGRSSVEGGQSDELWHFNASAQAAHSWGEHTLSAYTMLGLSEGAQQQTPRYGMGGFQQLSGYSAFQVAGSQVAMLRLGYQTRLTRMALTRGLLLGTTVEVGNAWDRKEDVWQGALRRSMSLYLGTDTPIGPVYGAMGYSPATGITLRVFVGRP